MACMQGLPSAFLGMLKRGWQNITKKKKRNSFPPPDSSPSSTNDNRSPPTP
ncbi:hypothetical protein PanWU01x14_271100, partial [Parasponia andersonii]